MLKNEAKDKKVKQAVDKIKSEFLQFLSSSQEEETTEEQTEPTGQNPEPPLPEELGSRRAQAESRPLPPQSRDLKASNGCTDKSAQSKKPNLKRLADLPPDFT